MAEYNANIAPFINETFYVTSEFGEERPVSGGGVRYHKGLDIAVPYSLDTPVDVFVYSMCNGYIFEIGYDPDGYGNYLIIKDNESDVAFLYGHLRIPDRSLVETGEQVRIGQAVQYEGSTGSSTGPHLHVEMQHMQGNFWNYNLSIDEMINPAEFMGIPNVEGISVFYDGIPIFPTEEKKGFPWVLYARKFRNRRK